MSDFMKEFLDLKISIDELKIKVDSIWRQMNTKKSSNRRSQSLNKQRLSSQIDAVTYDQNKKINNKVENWLFDKTDRDSKINQFDLAFIKKKHPIDLKFDPIVMQQPSKQQEYENILKSDIEEFSLCEFTDSSEPGSFVENEASFKSVPFQILGKFSIFSISNLTFTKQRHTS